MRVDVALSSISRELGVRISPLCFRCKGFLLHYKKPSRGQIYCFPVYVDPAYGETILDLSLS